MTASVTNNIGEVYNICEDFVKLLYINQFT
jgi:hypothetical protein